MKIIYADGSGNTYIITDVKGKVIEYLPVKPATSSSGVYDGGKHVKKALSEASYSRICTSIMAALNTPLIHAEHRVMGSGLITIVDKGNERSCILKPAATERGTIELLLKDLCA
jgi:hypothetical protein